jgi:hypothetical protein
MTSFFRSITESERAKNFFSFDFDRDHYFFGECRFFGGACATAARLPEERVPRTTTSSTSTSSSAELDDSLSTTRSRLLRADFEAFLVRRAVCKFL